MKARIVGRNGLVILFLALGITSACGAPTATGQPPSEVDVVTPNEDATPLEEEAVSTNDDVGPSEGDVQSSDGAATLQIPDGALPEGVDLNDLSIVPLETDPSSAGSPSAERIASYALEPSGLAFLEPISLTVTFPMPAGNPPLTIRLTSVEGEIEFLQPSDISADESGAFLTTVVPIMHFSRVDIEQSSFWESRIEVPDPIFRDQPFDLKLTITRTKDLLVDDSPPVRSRIGFVGEVWDLEGKWYSDRGATPKEVRAPERMATINGRTISFTREFTCTSDRAFIHYRGKAYFTAETWFAEYEDLKEYYDNYYISLFFGTLVWCDRLPTPTPTGEQLIGAVLEILYDAGGHAPYVQMPRTIQLRADLIDFSISGPHPWVSVYGEPLPSGDIQAFGSGTVAGYPGIQARFDGTFMDGNLEGVYSLGVNGGLPGGEAISFSIQGSPLQPPTPEFLDETPQAFFDLYSQAMQNRDIGFLLDRLHPVVIDMYGGAACQTYINGILEPTLQAHVNSVEGPMFWMFERDGQVHEIRQTLLVDLTITVGGEPSDRQVHLEQIDGLQTWFTDCGDPLQ